MNTVHFQPAGRPAPPSHAALRNLPLGQIQAAGWVQRQLRIEARGLSGHMDELEPDLIREPYLTRRRQKDTSVGWCAEISATYWTGLIQLAFTLNDARLKKKAARWVNGVLAAQEADGYLGSYKKTDNRGEDYNPMGVNWAIRALMAYYEATRRPEILKACRRGLLWFVRNWAGHKTAYAGPLLIESMLLVYHHTGDRRLLDWSAGYLRWLERHSPWPNHLPAFRSSRLDFNSAHVVAYGYWMVLPAIVYTGNGRAGYLQASVNAVRKVMAKCFQRTGAPASNNEYLSPPGSNCETEYCNFATYAFTFGGLAKITGRPEYGDYLEKIVFNGSQGAKKKDGRAIAYMSSPNQICATMKSSMYGNRPDMEIYAPVYPVACCPAQSVRVLPEYVRSLCLTDGRSGVYLPCYGPARMKTALGNGTTLTLDEITEYPFKETIAIKLGLSKPARFSLQVRIPGWCARARIKVNGRKVPGIKKPATYFPVTRTWQAGDRVDLLFPMDIRVVKVDDSAYSNKRPLAIERGPLLFALPIEPEWTAVPGKPLTPLPKGWSWYEAHPAQKRRPGQAYYQAWTWNVALDPRRLRQAGALRVSYRPIGKANPWELSPVVIKAPARKVRYAYSPNIGRVKNVEWYGGLEGLSPREDPITLVPYGCTNLRISYFPQTGRP